LRELTILDTFPGLTQPAPPDRTSGQRTSTPLQASIAASYGGDYARALALVAGAIVILTAPGIEGKGALFGTARDGGAADSNAR